MIALPPALLLGTLFCLCYGGLSHLLAGHTFRELLLFLVMSGIGFAFGQVIGTVTQSPFLEIGQLHLFEASLTAWILLGVTYLIERK